jgi:hypothetical protein
MPASPDNHDAHDYAEVSASGYRDACKSCGNDVEWASGGRLMRRE